MNKHQEALNRLESHSCHLQHEMNYSGLNEDIGYSADVEIIQTLIDKETPMKVRTFEAGSHECPKCQTSPSVIGCIRKHYETFAHYCHNCGQRLDWSSNDE